MGKELTYNAGGTGDTGSIPGLGRSPAGGHDNPLQYFCLGNPMDREAWHPFVLAGACAEGLTRGLPGPPLASAAAPR